MLGRRVIPPDNPIRYTEQYVTALKQELTRSDTGEWKQDSLARLTICIDVEGYRVREANPCSALIYARLVAMTVNYLFVKPNNNARRYLRYRVDHDIGALSKVVHPEIANMNLPYYGHACFRGKDLPYLQASYIMCMRLRACL